MDWERLTPRTVYRIKNLYYRHCPDNSGYRHMLQLGDKGPGAIYVTDPELDALATKSAAVQALVKAARLVNGIYRTVALDAALAPFETPDAT